MPRYLVCYEVVRNDSLIIEALDEDAAFDAAEEELYERTDIDEDFTILEIEQILEEGDIN